MIRITAILLSLCFAPFMTVGAQTTHTINLNAASFSPSTLTIEVGDTVEWVNSGGIQHNVNGSTDSYPANPVGFGRLDIATSFTYSFTFSTPGTYGYHCDVHGSPGSGMSGTLTVNTATSVEDELPPSFELTDAFPNPFRESTSVTLSTTRDELVRVTVYDASGREVEVLHDGTVVAGRPLRLDWKPADVAGGLYMVRFVGESFESTKSVTLVR